MTRRYSAAAWLAAALALALCAPHAQAATCPRAGAVKVPGAVMQKTSCLDDLTTAGTALTGHTDPSDYAGLFPVEQRNPSGVPGLQVDGYFDDTSTFNNENGWFHDAQFVIRLPDKWNGKLVITGAPGIRKQYSVDPVIGDFVLAEGYAYASTDKGNNGTLFYRDGVQPGDALAEWHQRVTELTIATKQAVAQYYGRAPARTYITGISNGGYLTRWQIEHHPELFDGGVDWEGTLMTPDGPNIFTYLPVALASYPKYRSTGDRAAHDAMIRAGFAPGSEFLWDDHYAEYWDLTQRTYREEFDPGYDGALEAGIPFCQSGMPSCDADYDYAARPKAVHDAVGKVSVSGDIKRPLLTLHGTLDALLPITTDSDVYARMVHTHGRDALFRYYVIQDGNHVDGRYDAHPGQLRPIQPCWHAAFEAMVAWVEQGKPPPPSQTVVDPHSADDVNSCTLAPATRAAGPGPMGGVAGTTAARRRPHLVARLRRGVVRGRLRLPSGLTARQACGSGSVVVRARRRVVALARVRSDCSFRRRLKHRPRGRLRARFTGNRALLPVTARVRR
jgi:hypothetical protein